MFEGLIITHQKLLRKFKVLEKYWGKIKSPWFPYLNFKQNPIEHYLHRKFIIKHIQSNNPYHTD